MDTLGCASTARRLAVRVRSRRAVRTEGGTHSTRPGRACEIHDGVPDRPDWVVDRRLRPTPAGARPCAWRQRDARTSGRREPRGSAPDRPSLAATPSATPASARSMIAAVFCSCWWACSSDWGSCQWMSGKGTSACRARTMATCRCARRRAHGDLTASTTAEPRLPRAVVRADRWARAARRAGAAHRGRRLRVPRPALRRDLRAWRRRQTHL